jgi:hypothetical protein
MSDCKGRSAVVVAAVVRTTGRELLWEGLVLVLLLALKSLWVCIFESYAESNDLFLPMWKPVWRELLVQHYYWLRLRWRKRQSQQPQSSSRPVGDGGG